VEKIEPHKTITFFTNLVLFSSATAEAEAVLLFLVVLCSSRIVRAALGFLFFVGLE
jgi:hypothetical protein